MWVEGPTLAELRDEGKWRLRRSNCDVLVCLIEDDVFAIENLCSHAFVPLHTGRLRGCEITCPSHLAKFDVRTGAVTRAPLEGDPEHVSPQLTFRAEVRNGRVYIEIPE